MAGLLVSSITRVASQGNPLQIIRFQGRNYSHKANEPNGPIFCLFCSAWRHLIKGSAFIGMSLGFNKGVREGAHDGKTPLQKMIFGVGKGVGYGFAGASLSAVSAVGFHVPVYYFREEVKSLLKN